ncbi:phage baseplate assembly protein V (plasmid) [Rouxiella badensis]|uniref:Baseplate assembly protein n=1 Tax=Rouxiella badensis TaxID=1646377 RepID=A0A1X0WB21_9GAMM|nr:phage baseplate assembly protein V [Rouxiella badensis]ORJ23964.1 baseplate assembly protein [Rouxiella badensis]WAT03213.1 phage baseplate assembly protein V [Rouxiella badensis]WAT03236.1 phage baseplate assembly protein V [Rouxiella badensis]WAT03244.1 phage baseplate assembly protein V [Rouxiella badensis]WAT03266.1 phage baseplate assembly protein V [Rouxiella badensis]
MVDLSRLYRQIKMLIGIGKVTAIDDGGLTQNLQYQTPLEIRSNTPRMADFGFSSGLPVGSDVVVAYLGGDRSSAVVIATNNKKYRHTGLNAGETVIYDQWGGYVKLTEAGIEVEANNQPVTVSNATIVTINATEKIVANTPRFECSGDIIDNSGSNSTTLKQFRDVYNEHAHFLKNVQSGNSTIESEVPGVIVE